MANIKVTVDSPVYDGMLLTVKAPCDCTEVTGLVVYYESVTEDTSETTSQVFTFRDAHGNTLTGVGNLFMEGSYIRVILDTTNGYAFIQNADTNGYLEGKFKRNTFVSTVRGDLESPGAVMGALYGAEINGCTHIYGGFTWWCETFLYQGDQTYFITSMPIPYACATGSPLYISTPATYYDSSLGTEYEGIAVVKLVYDTSRKEFKLLLNNDVDGTTKITYHFNFMYIA